MNIYRIEDTITGEPVSDIMGPWLIRSHAQAIDVAKRVATGRGNPQSVIRISGAGAMKCVRIVNPS